ncbi:unnamed protein product, partial [Prorocentrum cordatum]
EAPKLVTDSSGQTRGVDPEPGRQRALRARKREWFDNSRSRALELLLLDGDELFEKAKPLLDRRQELQARQDAGEADDREQRELSRLLEELEVISCALAELEDSRAWREQRLQDTDGAPPGHSQRGAASSAAAPSRHRPSVAPQRQREAATVGSAGAHSVAPLSLEEQAIVQVAGRGAMATVEDQVREQLRQQDQQIPELAATVQQLRAVPAPQPAQPAQPLVQFQPAVDTRLIGKPELLYGQRAKWSDWAFIFRAYLAAIDTKYPALLDEAEASEVAIRNVDLDQPWKASLSSQLYYLMVMLFRSAAQDKMSTVSSGEGLEAWRQSVLDWDPKIRTRRVGLLIKIPTAKFSGDIPQSLDQFEHLIREHEQQSKKVFDEDLKIGLVVVNMQDTDVQQHLVKNASRLETWKAMEEELLDMAKAKAEANKEKECFYCHKKGHIAAECRKKARDNQASDSGEMLAPMPQRVMVDTGAGRSVCPAGFDPRAEPDSSVKPTTLTTATGEEVNLSDGKRSHFQADDGSGVVLRYSDSDKVTVPVVSASESTEQGNWLVFGPGVQRIIGPDHAEHLKETVRQSSGLDMVKDRGVYWLEVWGATGQEEARPLCPAKAARKTSTRLDNNQRHLTPCNQQRKWSWCESCVTGKAAEDPHRQLQQVPDGATPKVCMDYLFLTQKAVEKEMYGVLNVLDAKSGAPFSGMVNQKGDDDYALAIAHEGVRFAGRTNLIACCDGESAINKLCDKFLETRPSGHTVTKVNTPKGSSQSAGLIERSNYEVEKEYRAVKHRLESVYKQAFPLSHKADGKTPYERLRGKPYNGEIVEFGECVYHKSPLSEVGKADDRWHLGVWLGKSMRSDEHLIGTANGVLLCRPIWRRPEKDRWDAQLLDRFVGSPWALVPPGVKEVKPREVYITLDKIIRLGKTPGCPGCRAPGEARHTAECRERFGKLVGCPVQMEWDKDFFSTKAGIKLDPQKVLEGKIREMTQIEAYKVKEDIPWSTARKRKLTVVNSKWLLEPKPTAENPEAVRARLVATEVNTYAREDVTQSTPPVKVFRIIVSLAVSKQRADGSWSRLVVGYDVSVAFFHADSDGTTAVIPPPDVRREEGESDSLDQVDNIMRKHFEVKILPRIGLPEFGGQAATGSHLKRTIRWTTSGFEWECDPQHILDLVELHGLTPGVSKGMSTPASKDTGKGDRDVHDPLGRGDAVLFRTGAGTLQYLAEDTPTVKFAASGIMEGMTAPLQIHQMRLARCSRYLLDHPGEVWLFDYQKMPLSLTEYCDSDWAADRETRKSVSCVVESFGKHLIDVSASKQSLLALSSGEAEFYAIIKGATQGVQTSQVIESFVGRECKLDLLSDSSAAQGICNRHGSGKVRHLSAKDLWVQSFFRDNRGNLKKVGTDVNWADLGTKAHAQARLQQLVDMMPLRRNEPLRSERRKGLSSGRVASFLAMLNPCR